jgi:hypothetical protein
MSSARHDSVYACGKSATLRVMQDEPDPPRKFYGFKPTEFDRANAAPPESQSAPTQPVTPAPDPGIARAIDRKIDIHELIRAGATPPRQPGSEPLPQRPNEVHDILRENRQRELAAGRYDLGPLDDSKRRKRIRHYWLAMILINVPLGCAAASFGPGAAIPFVCSIGGMGMLSAWLTWNTFFLRTHY